VWKMKFLIVREQRDDSIDLTDLAEYGINPPEDMDYWDIDDLEEYVASEMEDNIETIAENIRSALADNNHLSHNPVLLYLGQIEEYEMYHNILVQAIWNLFDDDFEYIRGREMYLEESLDESDEETQEDPLAGIFDRDASEDEGSEDVAVGTRSYAKVKHSTEPAQHQGPRIKRSTQVAEHQEVGGAAGRSGIEDVPRPTGDFTPEVESSELEKLRKTLQNIERRPTTEHAVVIPQTIRSNFRDPLEHRTFRTAPPQPPPNLEMKTFSHHGVPVTIFKNKTPS
jgi:hypothetical protein